MGTTPPTAAKRRKRHQQSKDKRNKLYSGQLHKGKSQRTFHELLYKLSRYFYENHLEEHLKAPLNNDAKSSYTQPAAFNGYFGIDNPDGTRTAYATGSGSQSIGMDPRTMKYPPANSLFRELMDRATVMLRKDTSLR